MSDALFEDGAIGAHPPQPLRDAFAAYNEIAERAGWPLTPNLTEARQRKIKTALKDCGGVHGWRAMLEKAAASDFLTGKKKTLRSPMGFKAKLDFFLRADKRTSVLDGDYDNAPAEGDSFARQLERIGTKHAAPKQPEMPFVQEPRDVRLRATIAIYRKLGKHADANRVEEQYAREFGGAPVLVPAPDAKDPDVVPMRESEKHSGKARDNIRRGPVFDISPADADQDRRAAHHAAGQAPDYDGVPEGDYMEEVGE